MSDPSEPSPTQSRGGCGNVSCAGGCLIVAGLLLVIGLCGGGGFYFWLSNRFEKFTAEKPIELPTVELPAAEIAELETRINSFKVAVENKPAEDDTTEPSDELVLTADEINALISKNEQARGKVFVKIEAGQISGDVSIPTDALPFGKGRYFNGTATFDVSMEAGVLIVTLVDAKVGDEQVPQAVLEAIGKENLAKDLYKNPENAKLMRRFDSISVEDDKIVLKLRQATTPTAPESDDSPTDTTAKPTTQPTDASEENGAKTK